MVKRLSQEKFIELVEKRHCGRFLFHNTAYQGQLKDVVITCKVHGDFATKPWTLLRSKIGCNACSKTSAEEGFVKRSLETHGDKYDYRNAQYVNSTTKVEVICPRHGSFWVEPYLHYDRGVGCMGCFQERNRLSLADFVAKAKEVHGDKYDYSDTHYQSHCGTITVKCPIHGYFDQEARVHLSGAGCQQCFIDRRRSTTERFIQVAKTVHGDKYDYTRVKYATNKTKVEIVCPTHGPFWMSPNGHVSSCAGCPRCKESKGETRVRTFLEKHEVEFLQEYRISPYRYRYDFYIPAYKTLIEFHGHQHYKPIELFGGESYYNEIVKNDAEKERIAKEEGYYLVVLDHRKMKDDRIERFLEMALRYKGHQFDESKTITRNTGPRRAAMSD